MNSINVIKLTYQSLSDFGTAASRMLSGFEDFEVAKMQILGKKRSCIVFYE